MLAFQTRDMSDACEIPAEYGSRRECSDRVEDDEDTGRALHPAQDRPILRPCARLQSRPAKSRAIDCTARDSNPGPTD